MVIPLRMTTADMAQTNNKPDASFAQLFIHGKQMLIVPPSTHATCGLMAQMLLEGIEHGMQPHGLSSGSSNSQVR